MGQIMKPASQRKLTEDQQQLVLANGRLVSYAVRIHARGNPPLLPEEVKELAEFILCEAAAKYDPTRGIRFGNYALSCIQRGILDERRRRLALKWRCRYADIDPDSVVKRQRCPIHEADDRLTIELIRTRLLTADDWDVLISAYRQWESIDELAQRHGVTTCAVRKRVARIVGRLRRRLHCA